MSRRKNRSPAPCALPRKLPPRPCARRRRRAPLPCPGRRASASAPSSPVPFGSRPPVCAACSASARLGGCYITMTVDLAKRSTSAVFTFLTNFTFDKLPFWAHTFCQFMKQKYVNFVLKMLKCDGQINTGGQFEKIIVLQC